MDPTTSKENFLGTLASPPQEIGPFPFWFWNDDLDEAELLRQLHAFHAGGLGGVLIHPRIGLSRRVGYLTKEYLRLVRLVVDECARLGMKVVLYDEASYPSGSACGQVVATNPAYAAQALALVHKEIVGPWTGYWRPHLGRSLVDELVCVVVAPERDGVIDPQHLNRLIPDKRGLVRLDLPKGVWRVMACIETPSAGSIRGAFPDQESGWATAPPAGDIMNPEAVETFIRLTHDAYARTLREHLGTTVVAMFTDEPSPLGRSPRRGVKPYTRGFVDYLKEFTGHEEIESWLPALWLDYGPETDRFRSAYDRAVHQRTVDVYYAAQSDWCARHGLALTGHPHASNDMTTLSTFHWPGQDMVWRWVVPENESGLAGPDSVAPKAATSAARALNRKRIATELFGAYGWGLSLDEAKWLIDWHLLRGNNLFLMHAFFYSIQGGRAYESEPDLGVHNVWWPHFQQLVKYTRRMCWLLTECEHRSSVAILSDGYNLSWTAAHRLYQNQIDFLYIDEPALQRAHIDDGTLRIGSQAYRCVVVDDTLPLSGASQHILSAFEASGGQVIHELVGESWIDDVRASANQAWAIHPTIPDLRVMHVRKDGFEVFLLSNEGEATLSGNLELAADLFEQPNATVTSIDPLRMTTTPLRQTGATRHGPTFALTLGRRESRILIPGVTADEADEFQASHGCSTERQELELQGPWTLTAADGGALPQHALGDWTAVRELECYSGTITYSTVVHLPKSALGVTIDLGHVGDIAEVHVNGRKIGLAMWPPYRLETGPEAWQVGENRLDVHVTNSSANALEGAMRPSGLMGPVRLFL